MLGRSGPNLIRRRAGFDLEVVCLCHFSSNPWLNLRLGSELKKHKVWLRRQRTLLGARRRRRGFGSSTAAPSKTLSTGPYIATSSTTTYHSFILFPFPLFNLYFFPNSLFLLFQASNLRERFEENRHVVRFPLFTYLPDHRICNIVSIHTSLVIFCTLIVFYLE